MRLLVIHGRWLPLVVLGVMLVGCGKKSKGPKFDLVPAAGTVTLDGKPLADAKISFIFQGKPPEGFYGSGAVTDAQGHYELQTMDKKGTVAGTYKITLSKPVNESGVAIKPEEGMDLEQLRTAGLLKEAVPVKYTDPTTTDLTLTVEKGKADGYNLDLKSG